MNWLSSESSYVSIQPKPKTGLDVVVLWGVGYLIKTVSIQPKPKTGLEAEVFLVPFKIATVSIQPKPKTGLEVTQLRSKVYKMHRFNPAEAEDGFRSKPFLYFCRNKKSFNPAEAEDGFRRN